MQGKDTFTTQEAGQIRSLLREKGRSDRDTQKKIRRQLRDLRFYITDFDSSYSGFTIEAFENLISAGRIHIVAQPTRR